MEAKGWTRAKCPRKVGEGGARRRKRGGATTDDTSKTTQRRVDQRGAAGSLARAWQWGGGNQGKRDGMVGGKQVKKGGSNARRGRRSLYPFPSPAPCTPHGTPPAPRTAPRGTRSGRSTSPSRDRRYSEARLRLLAPVAAAPECERGHLSLRLFFFEPKEMDGWCLLRRRAAASRLSMTCGGLSKRKQRRRFVAQNCVRRAFVDVTCAREPPSNGKVYSRRARACFVWV